MKAQAMGMLRSSVGIEGSLLNRNMTHVLEATLLNDAKPKPETQILADQYFWCFPRALIHSPDCFLKVQCFCEQILPKCGN